MNREDLIQEARKLKAEVYQNEQSYLRKEIKYGHYKHEQMIMLMRMQVIFQNLCDFNTLILEYSPYIDVIEYETQKLKMSIP